MLSPSQLCSKPTSFGGWGSGLIWMVILRWGLDRANGLGSDLGQIWLSYIPPNFLQLSAVKTKNILLKFNFLCLIQVHLLLANLCKLQISLIPGLCDFPHYSRSIRIRNHLFLDVSSIGQHELVPDPEVVTSILTWWKDS